MYPLFELVRVLSVKNERDVLLKPNVSIEKSAWFENDSTSMLAVACSNGYILLRYTSQSQHALVRQIPWSHDPVRCLNFDPVGSWLLVLGQKLYIVPVANVMNPGQKMKGPWSENDVTAIDVLPKNTEPTYVVWWQSFDEFNIAIVATKKGWLYLIDLQLMTIMTKCLVAGHVTSLDLILDDISSQLLITIKGGQQQKLLLETRNAPQPELDDDLMRLGYHDVSMVTSILNIADETKTMFSPVTLHQFTHSEVTSRQCTKGHHCVAVLDHKTSTYRVYNGKVDNIPYHTYKLPLGCSKVVYTGKLLLALNIIQGKKLCVMSSATAEMTDTEHEDKKEDFTLQQFDLPNNEHIISLQKKSFPFFWHEKLEESHRPHDHGLETSLDSSHMGNLLRSHDYGLFLSVDNTQSRDHEVTMSLDNQTSHDRKPTIPLDDTKPHDHENIPSHYYNRGAMSLDNTQSRDYLLNLSLDTVSNISVGSWQYGGLYGIPISDHLVLDGCVVVTDSAVYECRPRISPQRLFLQLTIEQNSIKAAESLATALALDMSSLFELSAEYKLTAGDFAQAVKLFQLSKCPPVKRVAAFACYGRIPEVITYIRQSLSSGASATDNLSHKDRGMLADLAVVCYVYQMNAVKGQCRGKVDKQFSEFLLSNSDFDHTSALKTLAENRLLDHLFLVAKAHGLVYEALQLLASQGEITLPATTAQMLVQCGYAAHLLQAGNGTLLRSMPPQQFADLVCLRPSLALSQKSRLENILPLLNQEQLLKIAVIFDPSKQHVLNVLMDSLKMRNRSTSYGSLASLTSEAYDASKATSSDTAGDFLMFFGKVFLALNQRYVEENLVTLPLLLPQTQTAPTTIPPSSHMTPRQFPIGCGYRHCVILRNNDVFSWGKQHCGRLGIGESTPNGRVVSPTLLKPLLSLNSRVIAIACGREHTLVNTEFGVFGWGSSRYGQLGTGISNRCYGQLTVIETMATVTCVAISCGQYHSLFLSDQYKVYSCGWGVHGQLGHSNPEDKHVPTPIKLDANITHIAAAYCHSVLLSDQGKVYTFGCGLFGQLGHGANTKSSTPVLLTSFHDPVTHIATGYFHSLAVTSKNQLYTWGSHPHSLRQIAQSRKQERKLRHQHTLRRSFTRSTNYLAPAIVDTSYVNGQISQISCGAYHNALLTKDGDVYTWGRSTEGQLGSPRKTDQKQPTMLTLVNDRHMTYIQCGSEFTVAMDTDNLVWVWGKNDCGQLGLPIADQSHKVKKGSHDHIQPVVLHSLPSIGKAQQSSASVAVGNQTWGGETSQYELTEIKTEETIEIIDLQRYCPLTYHSSVMAPLLQMWGESCDLTRLTQLCIDGSDWLAAAHIYAYQLNYPMALTCHLRAITQVSANQQLLTNDVVTTATTIVNLYLGQICCTTTVASDSVRPFRNLILQLTQFWHKHSLPWQQLESILLDHVDKFACVLALIMFHENDTISTNTSDVQFHLSKDVRDKFTPKFMLKILQENLKLIKSNNFARQLLSENFLDETTQKRELKLENTTRLVPYDRLWQEIEQNLQKDWNTHRYITVSSRDLYNLQLQMNVEPLNLESNSQFTENNREVTAFSCSHSFTKSSLQKEVGRLFNDLDSDKISELQSLYNQSNVIALPCPKCLAASG